MYEFDRHDSSEYVTDTFRWLVTPLINGSPHVLDDKYLFGIVLSGLGVPTPAILATYGGDGRVLMGGRAYSSEDASLLEQLETLGTVVFKPRGGGGGSRIFFVRVSAGRLTVNEKAVALQDLFSYMGAREFIACSFVRQHPYAADIFPSSTNTVRVLTMVDPATGSPFVAAAVHRFGASGSVPVDNFSQGGLSVHVDVSSGVLGSGVAFPKDGVLRRHDSHPETGKPIRGIQIPGWPAIRSGLLHLAAQLPGDLPYVGWDVVATPDGYSVLEGNKYSDVNLLQVHRPLLADSRVRAFYQFHAARVGRGGG